MLSKTKRDDVRRQFRTLRIAVNKTQLEVEREAGLKAGRYWKIETGVQPPEADECKRLARVLKVAPEQIPGCVMPEAKAS